MPLVKIRCNPDKISAARAARIVRGLGQIVADALSCTEGMLMPSDVEIHCEDTRTLDANVNDVSVTIYAQRYPSRVKNLENTQQRISREVDHLTPDDASWSVWLMLVDGSYGASTVG